MNITLLLGARIPSVAGATALAIVDGEVAWTGDDSTALVCFGDTADVVHLGGALVTPAFVDAHVHTTAAGLHSTGPDLAGCNSLEECLDTIARHARPGVVLWGHGWDETRWPEDRPPTRAELDRAAGAAPVYLPRVDGHSALVSSALLRRVPHAVGAAGWADDAPLTREAHHHARRAARESVTPGQRRDAQQAFLTAAAAHGVAVVHECAGPDISGIDDLADLLAADHGVEVVGYWGEAASTADQARDLLTATGAHGLAGDLCCDGSLGSRTAALRTPYADEPASRGFCYLDAEQIAAHVIACTLAGTQAGFHVIGDAAADAVLAGFAAAEIQVGTAALRQCTHRLEHLEMVDSEQIKRLADWGIVASVQPSFEAAWGGPAGMYARRLGAARAAAMNPYAEFAALNVVLAFGSDAPVTPADPWATVQAAVRHHTPESGINAVEALAAHTYGGYRAAAVGNPLAGTLFPGAPASYAIWDNSADFGWLDSPDAERPACLRTVHRGRVLYEQEGALR